MGNLWNRWKLCLSSIIRRQLLKESKTTKNKSPQRGTYFLSLVLSKHNVRVWIIHKIILFAIVILCDIFSTRMYLISYITWKKSWIFFSGETEKHIKTFIADFLLKKNLKIGKSLKKDSFGKREWTTKCVFFIGKCCYLAAQHFPPRFQISTEMGRRESYSVWSVHFLVVISQEAAVLMLETNWTEN